MTAPPQRSKKQLARLLRGRPNQDRRDRVQHLLGVVAAFTAAGREPPGHVLYALVALQDAWPGCEIPASVLRANRVLSRAGRPPVRHHTTTRP